MPEPTAVWNDFNVTELAIFDALAFIGLAVNAAVLAPAIFSASVRRSATWSGLIISFIVYSWSYLVIFPWQKLQSQFPPFGLCFLQATLVFACPALVTMSYTAFVIDFYLQMASINFHNRTVESNARIAKLLVIVCWMVFFVVIFVVIVLVQQPSTIQLAKGRFYCSVTMASKLAAVNVILTVLAAVILFPLEFHMAYILYKNWGAFRRLNIENSSISFSRYIRLTLFLLIGTVAVGLSAAIIPNVIKLSSASAGWRIILPTIPIIGAITLGTQADIMKAWIFWRSGKDQQYRRGAPAPSSSWHDQSLPRASPPASLHSMVAWRGSRGGERGPGQLDEMKGTSEVSEA